MFRVRKNLIGAVFCRNSSALAAELPSPTTTLNFELSDNQKLLQTKVRKFVEEHVIPKAALFDKTGEYPWEIIRKAHAARLTNIQIPRKYGGLGLDLVSDVIFSENFGYGCQGVKISLLGNELAYFPVLLCGSDDVQKKFLPRLIEEPLMAAYCVTEPGAGSDVAGIKTRAEKKGDEYVINGSKMWITNGGVANWYFLLARTDPNPKTPAGKAFTAFAFDADLPGIIKGKKEIHMGVKCADNRGIFFEDVRVPASQIIGAPGEGFKVAMKTFDLTRPLVAAAAVGLIGRCLDEATKYAFEKNICADQAVWFKLADMASKMEYSRLMTLRAAAEVQSGKRGSLYPSLAKKIASEAAVEAAMSCVEICGHDGCNADYPVEKLLRDSKVLTIGEGTSEMQNLVIGRELLQKIRKNRSYFLHV